MFFFAHVGITLGASVLVSGAVNSWRKASNSSPKETQPVRTLTKTESFSEAIGLKPLSRFLDIRLLMVGSMVPDIIDKPLAFLGFGNGRSITHTLLVFLVVLLTALYLYVNHKKTGLLAIAIGMFTHLVLDFMWVTPHTFLWPTDGWGFPTPVIRPGFGQIKEWWNTLLNDAGVDISDGIGLLVLLGAGWIVIKQKGLKAFLQRGKI
jgi:inner membrane protein